MAGVRRGRRFAHGFHGSDHPFTLSTLNELEGDRRARLQTCQQTVVGKLELHGHRRPLKGGYGAMGKGHRAGFGIQLLHLALTLVPDGRSRLARLRGAWCLRLGSK